MFGRPSTIVLVATNLIPLWGVLFSGWQVFPVIFLFWFENVAIGILNVLRIAFAAPDKPILWLAKIFLIPFFCFHYGMFCFVHGIFVAAIFGGSLKNTDGLPNLFSIGSRMINTEQGYLWAALAIFLSHGFSFVVNYLGEKEFMSASPMTLMTQPYLRVVILHVTLIAGTFLMLVFKSSTAGLALLIGLKIFVDLKAHTHEHLKNYTT